MDPVTLEVTITDALRKPMAQLAPETLADLIALAESDDAPASLKAELARFLERVGREIGDVPDGPSWAEMVGEIAALEPARIPGWLRARLAEEGEREPRPPASAEVVAQAAQHWDQAEPEPFALGTRGAKVQRTTKASKPSATSRSSKPVRKTATRARAPVDEALSSHLQQVIIERLARYTENGLAEQILLVGIRKQVQGDHPSVRGKDILDALKVLENTGKVRKSAGRWIPIRRWKASDAEDRA